MSKGTLTVEQMPKGSKVGVDASVHSLSEARALRKHLEQADCSLVRRQDRTGGGCHVPRATRTYSWHCLFIFLY